MNRNEETREAQLEQAYWEFDALRTRKGRPMAERDAFKTVLAAMMGPIPTDPGGLR